MDELKFLDQLLPGLQSDRNVIIPPGDDCAAIRWHGDKLMLLAVDQVVAEKHFLVDETAPELVGRKLLARNLSDIAAMGGKPSFILVSSAASKEFSMDYHNRVVKGIMDLAAEYGVALIGGDVAGAPHGFSASLTIVGEVAEDKVLRRTGASLGDVVFVTGKLGDTFFSQHHLNFQPRLEEGQFLAENGFASAMMDISDGILLDGYRLSKMNGLGIELELAKLPARSAESLIKNILTDGEDYELLFTCPQEKADALLQQWPFSTELTMVGRVSSLEKGVFSAEGENLLEKYSYFDHFGEE